MMGVDEDTISILSQFQGQSDVIIFFHNSWQHFDYEISLFVRFRHYVESVELTTV